MAEGQIFCGWSVISDSAKILLPGFREQTVDEADVNIRIGRASRHHFPALQAIELAAFETLRAAGAITGEATASSNAELQQYLNDGLLLAAFEEKGAPVGYAGGYIMEDALHIGEMDVHPDWQRKGLGRRLVNALLEEGRARKLKGSTLTTDRFAPFNAPFYSSMGFQIVHGDAGPQRLRTILAAEHARGLDPQRRVAMQLAF